MEKKYGTMILVALTLVFVAVMTTFVFFKFVVGLKDSWLISEENQSKTEKQSAQKLNQEEIKLTTFVSAAEFSEYLEEAKESVMSWGAGMISGMDAPMGVTLEGVDGMNMQRESSAAKGLGSAEAPVPARVSETNVQVAGIDEPDIVKTNGEEIYFSTENRTFWSGVRPTIDRMQMDMDSPQVLERVAPGSPGVSLSEKMVDPDFIQGPEPEVRVIQAFPPAEMKKITGIEKEGKMLLKDEALAVFTDQREIYGFDVADPAAPKETWKLEINNNSSIVDSRLMGDKVYLVTSTSINRSNPCPIEVLRAREGEAAEVQKVSISCNEIYHPQEPAPTQATFNVLVFDIKSGRVEKKTAFVGSYGQTTVYMAPESIYVAFNAPGDPVQYALGFVRENEDLFGAEIAGRVEKLAGYDLGQAAKLAELNEIMNNFSVGMEGDKQLEFNNEVNNRAQKYLEKHQRDLERTAIAKVDAKNLKLSATGLVAGHLLNQFSMDEYKENLRVATTVSGQGGIMGISARAESVNDVYVLDEKMRVMGTVQNLGLDERIYSARFIGDRGYLVTFKQIDPFFVLDLSNPKKPVKQGELKIPGYSSYLHPLAEHLVLGIGEEENQVKLAVFDVSDPANPKERTKYLLDEYFSEIQNTHHAFLLDDQHKVFFLPGSKGGYVFGWQGGQNGQELELKKAVSETRAKRALYLDDYLYVLGEEKIRVFNEKTWEEVKELGLE